MKRALTSCHMMSQSHGRDCVIDCSLVMPSFFSVNIYKVGKLMMPSVLKSLGVVFSIL